MNARIPYSIEHRDPDTLQIRAASHYEQLQKRRTIRDFSPEPIPDGVIEDLIRTAGTAPNGANLQPWHFAVVRDAGLKSRIRLAAEKEEQAFYESRASDEWLEALAALGTNADKPFLETAPVLIAVFMKSRARGEDSKPRKTYYPKESVGIATGFLISAIHQLGLACLTHTPSPMNFLNTILHRPMDEKPFLLLVVGYPASGCTVPAIDRLPLEGIASFH